MGERFSLGVVSAQVSPEDGSIVPVFTGGEELDLTAYSEFKYGNGFVANEYGQNMATQLLDAQPDLLDQPIVHVTSSAYKVAPPAAHSLMAPFIQRAQAEAAARGSATRFVPFKINRGALTNGDYATMTVEEREKAMASNGLSLPADIDLEGGTVVALDDICVTGSHEQAVERVLAPAALSALFHGYVLSVDGGARHPKLEATINATAVNSMMDIVELSHKPGFIPNARLCKFILSQSVADVASFCHHAPKTVVAKVGKYMKGDELDTMEKYGEAYDGFAEITLHRANDIAAQVIHTAMDHLGKRDVQPSHDTERVNGKRPFREQVRLGCIEAEDPEESHYIEHSTPEQIDMVIDLLVHKGFIRKDQQGFWHATNAGQNAYVGKQSRSVSDRFMARVRDLLP